MLIRTMQEWERVYPPLARLGDDGRPKRPYHGPQADEALALIQTNKTMDAEIERLLTLRLDADGGIEFLVRTGNLKRRTGPHCLCAASEGDEEVWIGCANFSDNARENRCRHKTGWFHPRCVGLGAKLRSEDDVKDHGSWQCPCCRNAAARREYKDVYLEPDDSDEEAASDSGSE